MEYEMLTKKELKKIIEDLETKHITNCEFCGSKLKRTKRRRYEVVCTWKGCKKRKSFWSKTIFYKLKVSVFKCMRVLELFMQKAPVRLIRYILRLKKKTVSRILKRASKFLIPKLMSSTSKIGGNNSIVEIDESKFVKRNS
jgi:hypothetical protein